MVGSFKLDVKTVFDAPGRFIYDCRVWNVIFLHFIFDLG